MFVKLTCLTLETSNPMSNRCELLFINRKLTNSAIANFQSTVQRNIGHSSRRKQIISAPFSMYSWIFSVEQKQCSYENFKLFKTRSVNGLKPIGICQLCQYSNQRGTPARRSQLQASTFSNGVSITRKLSIPKP